MNTCSATRAPVSLATTPPFMNSSATLTASAGTPRLAPRRSRTSLRAPLRRSPSSSAFTSSALREGMSTSFT